jgi:hypothetical protein
MLVGSFMGNRKLGAGRRNRDNQTSFLKKRNSGVRAKNIRTPCSMSIGCLNFLSNTGKNRSPKFKARRTDVESAYIP